MRNIDMKMNKFVSVLTFAFAALGASVAPAADSTGDIIGFYVCNAQGEKIAPPGPNDAYQVGDTVYFKMRLASLTYGGPRFHLNYDISKSGISMVSEDLARIINPPAIGIYVNGTDKKQSQGYVWATLAPGDNPKFTGNCTDFIFCYTVKPGDFALPIRLADEKGNLIADPNNISGYCFNFGADYPFESPWSIDNATGGGAGEQAVLRFDSGDSRGWLGPAEDPNKNYNLDYDEETGKKGGMYVRTVDFDDEMTQGSDIWRVVYADGGGVSNTLEETRLVMTGVATNSTYVFLWSENENIFQVTKEPGFPGEIIEKDVTVTPDGGKEKRHILRMRTADFKYDGVNVYANFNFKSAAGSAEGQWTNLVLSAFDDYTYKPAYSTAPAERNKDYLTVKVGLCAPRPPSVVMEVTPSPAFAPQIESSTLETYSTKLSISLTQGYEAGPIEIEIRPGMFADEGVTPPNVWHDYIRFSSGKADKNVTKQYAAQYAINPTVVFEAGELKPRYIRWNTTGGVIESELEGGVIYVYGLYADEWTNGKKGNLRFAIAPTDPTITDIISGWDPAYLDLKAEAPVAKMPEDALVVEAQRKTPVEFSISVADIYRNRKSVYKLYYQTVNVGADPVKKNWLQIDGDWTLSADDVLTKTVTDEDRGEDEVLPTVTYNRKGTYETYFYVVGTNGLASAQTGANVLKAKVTVLDGKKVVLEIKPDGGDWTTDVTSPAVKEGTEFSVRAKLGSPTASGDDVWAFLAPVDAEACAAVNVAGFNAVTNVSGAVGVRIYDDSYDEFKDTVRFKLADGMDPAKTFEFDVVLCSTRKWDPANQVFGYEAEDTIRIAAENVQPTVKSVEMTGERSASVEKTGETMHDVTGAVAPISVGTQQKFTFNVDDVAADLQSGKGETDKTHEFTIECTIVEESGATAKYELTGDPAKTNVYHTFTGAGLATVSFKMHDKDMWDPSEKWTDPFAFKVQVTKQPSIVFEETEMAFDETAAGSIRIKLSDDNQQSITSQVTVVYKTTDTNPLTRGFVKLSGGTLVKSEIVDGHLRESYEVLLDNGQAELVVDSADGTVQSGSGTGGKGYELIVEVTDERVDAVTKQKWKDRYRNSTAKLSINNVSPSYKPPTYDALAPAGIKALGPKIGEEDCYTNMPGLGVDFTFQYAVSDIVPDLTNGITVLWSGDKTISGSGLSTNVFNTSNYTATVRFTEPGVQKLHLTLIDKDGGRNETFAWWFMIESTKSLVTIPNGPSGKGDSAMSLRYSGAVGRGEGHIWANASFAAGDSYWLTWNCSPSLASVTVYGYGYKTNAVDNGELDSKHDQAITPSGGSPATEGSYYTYAGDRDSYLYGWITYAAASGGASAGAGAAGASGQTTFALNPETKTSKPTPVPLPAVNGNNGQNASTATYPTTFVEGVFSCELLPSDNLGDMNADGIPDAYLLVPDYNFGVYDSASGTLTGDDLRDLNFTEGESDTMSAYCSDYLPTMGTAAYAKFIPGLSGTWVDTGRPFVPRMKVRGFDEDDAIAIMKRGTSVSALNDATRGIVSGVESDKVYTNPREDAASTLNYVEWLAWSEWATAKYGPDAVSNATHFTEWSPERPTNPTKADTDGDGLTDGWEYYIWYNAHVGYVENGVHKYLTGRAYDPRNPGEGRLITSAELEAAFDPQNPTAYKLRDIDNDGLPDLIEFAIGTNPFDFDTDGDGLPDGFEILLNGTDPLNAYTTKGICDAMRNYDGDAMAFTTPELEKMVEPKPMNILPFSSFATVNDGFTGDSDGVQWYVGREFAFTNFVVGAEETGHVIQVNGERYFTTLDVRATDDGRLGTDLTSLGAAWKVVNAQEKEIAALGAEVPADLDYIRLAPARLAVGTQLELIEEQAPVEEGEEPPEEPVMVKKYVVDRKAAKMTFGAKLEGLNAAWIYGSDLVSTETTANNMLNLGGFGMLAMGRYLDVEEGEALAELPSAKRPVALMHYLVYQEFGFDPRTAWNAHTPLAARWGKTADGEVVESQYNSANGYAGIATRTREFTAYDEFLLLSFWLENGTITDADVTATQANPWYKIWSKYTTNPQGPGELWEPDNENFKGRTAETASDTNGADTDQDGVPDGWELYVMSGPKVKEPLGGLKFRFVGPYSDNHFSHFGPFEADAGSASWTDLGGTSGYESTPGDGDGLTELREFAGTDSCNWYSKPQEGNAVAFSTTIVRPEADAKWLNKFFPTDPWNPDTDGDGITDGDEVKNWGWAGTTANFKCGNFIYGTPVDNGSTCIPGGGLNPLTIDTDGDGLPDLWEAQFAGSKIYDGPEAELTKDADGKVGNPKQGLCDGMDGTVSDAFTYPLTVKAETAVGGTNSFKIVHTVANGMAQVVDRDYDHDGLQNWQEYLTGMMRCWRYDDPLSRWDAIPEDVYYKVDGNGKTTFDVSEAAKKMFPDDENPVGRFWYETLVNVKGEWYNPHLITGMSPANYMTRVTNPWDKAFTDDGTYYWLVDRIGGTTLDALWCDPNAEKHLPLGKEMSPVPLKYACCSPIDPDSDHDGLDDYYELFHGMNPLLGESGVLVASSTSDSLFESAGPCDLVYDAWYVKGKGALEAWAKSATDAQANFWQRDAGLKAKHDARFAKSGVTPPENGYDFEVYPWLNGLQMADPDGDDIRNLYESIQPKLSGGFYLHTDPTPLWMTDSTYSNSLVRLFFRMPTRPTAIELAGESFEYDGTPYFFRDFDGFKPAVPMVSPNQFVSFTIDKWKLQGDGYNWMYSFEENEGYDSDHDFISDYEEAQGTKRTASDPQDADSPRHRQALYFPGWDPATGRGSVLQSLPEELEKHPLGVTDYPDTQLLQTFTVECWVKPDVVDPNVAQTVLERAVWVGASQVADKEYMRKNFQIAIRNGKWYVKYDTNGTEPTDTETGKTFEYYSPNVAVTSRWTHVAATYDGNNLTVFVDGVANAIEAHLSPANAVSALVLHNEPGRVGDYWYAREYGCHAFVIGASLQGSEALGPTGYEALDITRCVGWNAYHEFFCGYVDEVRVWDGARKSDDVINDYNNRKRYDRTDVLANREAVYEAWQLGRQVPELLHHWTFDSVAGAENAAQVAKWPRGFGEGDCPAMSRPDGYVIDWWKKIVDVFGSAYAGKLDWVTWIPDTVGHLPRYDGTTLDSAYWSETYAGTEAGEYAFPMTAEPVTRWTQMTYGGVDSSLMYQSTGLRHRLAGELFSSDTTSKAYLKFEFAGRNRTCSGTDLLPLGGAFVKYVDTMWDDQGASSTWELTGGDANANGLPDWWEAYADQNYRPEDMPSDEPISWSSTVVRQGVKMTAGEAYLRDLAAGMYVNAAGKIVSTHVEDGKVVSGTPYAQTAKSDGLIPDWWKDLFKISGADPFDDGDYDGLNNYHEYVASEVLPFSLRLDPLAPRSDKQTLDYFQKIGKLYVGEMLTDHDLMEDHWERSLGDVDFADATVWDALKDGDGDGWTNFEENRYNGYRMSTLAQLISHKVGDVEARDFPVPVINLKVVYHGNRVGAVSPKAEDAKSPSGQGGQEKDSGSENLLIVRTYTDGEMMKGDAKYSVQPGAPVDKYVYVGGWEDRKVYGAMSPGHVDIRTVKIEYFDMGNNNGSYTWKSKTTGQMHSKRPYVEYKAALDAGDVDTASMLIDSWSALSEGLPGTDQSMIPTIDLSREPLLQIGYVDINRKRVCTMDLDSGEFVFDMSAMRDALQLSDPNVSVENAIFRVRYTSMVPNLQNEIVTLSLATPDSGFVRGGKNAIEAFYDLNGDGLYTPGEPYGILRDVEIGWSGRALEMELTDMTAVTPRVDLWSDASDRAALTGGANEAGAIEVVTIKTTETMTTNGVTTTRVVDKVVSNGFENVVAPAPQAMVNVSRCYVDGVLAEKAGLNGINPLVFRQTFDSDTRTFLHEGDFLKDGALDLDWGTFDAVTAFMRSGRPTRVYDLTNVTYLVTFNEPADISLDQPTNQAVKALSTLVTRRFERVRTVPTPCPVSEVFKTSRPTFAWKIEGEDAWASQFGTTYTAFKVQVKSLDGKLVYDSGVRRLPAKDREGVYTWTAPLYVGSVTAKGEKFENLTKYTWSVALYNAKFSDDTYRSVTAKGSPFCKAQTFRMNVTTQDTSSRQVVVGVSYAGPATGLAGKVRVQAFESPDFTGDAVAETTADAADATVSLIGLPEGSYFIRAYIDTNGNGVRDSWESWGYLCERDRANKPGLFNPVMAEAKFSPNTKDVRTVYIEDCDTNLNYFPDVWEAEQNGGEFDPAKVPPVDGNAELIGANPNLASTLSSGTKTALNAALPPKMSSLASVPGVALMTGLDLEDVVPTAGGFEVKSEVDPETLTIVGLNVDAAKNRVFLKVGAETTANVDSLVANFLNVTVKKGAEVTVKVEHADSPVGPWTTVPNVNGTVTVDRAGTEIEVNLDGELPAQGFFRAKIEE